MDPASDSKESNLAASTCAPYTMILKSSSSLNSSKLSANDQTDLNEFTNLGKN